MIRRIFSRLDQNSRQALNQAALCGMFWFAWAVGCYQTVYLQELGFSASQLGLLNAISSGVGIVSVSFWGMVSDRIGSLRKIFMILLISSSVLYALTPLIPAGLPFSPILFTAYLPFVNFFRSPTSSFSENILVRNCNELRLNYGMLRSVGSLLFTISSFAISFLLPYVGVKNTFWLTGLLIIIVVALTVFAREPAARPKKGDGEKAEKLELGRLFHSRGYVMFLVFTFFFYLAACSESSFIPYLMAEVGVPSQQYGVLLGYRALLEVPFLLLMAKFRRRFPLRNLIVCAAVLMAVECAGFGLLTNGLGLMLLFCTFFGLGNGLFIGASLNYIYELAPDGLKATAQTLFASVSSVAGILGNLLGGMVLDGMGAKSFYLVIAAAYCLSALIFILSFGKRKAATGRQEVAETE